MLPKRMYAKAMGEKENDNDDISGAELKEQGSEMMRQEADGGKWSAPSC